MTIRTSDLIQRISTAVRGRLRSAADVAIDNLNPGSGRGLAIEPLEERIAPGTLIVNPPGAGGGTTVDLPDAAEDGATHAIENSPVLEPPAPPPPDPNPI